MAIWNPVTKLWIETCYKCNTRFGMSDITYRSSQERKGEQEFFCPNGHGQVYIKDESDLTKVRRERDRLRQQVARLMDERREETDRADAEKRRASAQKGVATRLKNRVKAGLCPCCNQSFKNLAQHMESEHPNFAKRHEKNGEMKDE
jgi:hypothetical protein